MMRYRKGQDQAADAAFSAGQQYGKVRVGGDRLFFRKGFSWYVIAAQEIRRAYRRIEQVKSHTGCCENDFDIHRLILEMADGSQQTVLIGDALFRHEPELLADAMQAAWPHILFAVPHAKER